MTNIIFTFNVFNAPYSVFNLSLSHPSFLFHKLQIMYIHLPLLPISGECFKATTILWTADRLAQLLERWTTLWEVSGSSPRPDQHSGS